MNTHSDKTLENKSQTVANRLPKLQSKSESTFQFVDNRPEAIAQRKLQEAISNSPRVQQLKAYHEMANNSPQVSQLRAIQDRANNCPQFSKTAQLQAMADNHSAQQQQPIQKKENNTGLPDNLKTGMENLSGMSLDDVKVHRNSDKPAQLQAHAYAQGTDIHLGPGQEKHLPHEAWHVVQQKQGRVKPTMQMKGKVNVNDDAGLEKEADVMGAKALQAKTFQPGRLRGQELIANELPHVVQQMGAAVRLVSQPAATESKHWTRGKTQIVQRKIIPQKDAESKESVEDLKKAYNTAWSYLWTSETAKKVCQYVNTLNEDVTISVGAIDSDADAAKNIVRWNPHEKNVLLNKGQTEIFSRESPKVETTDIVGTNSAALTLLHELGHIKQHYEARQVHAGEAVQGLIDDPVQKVGGHASIKVVNQVDLLERIKGEVKTFIRGIKDVNTVSLMENDNVTVHERPTAKELGEKGRKEYLMSFGNAENYKEYYSEDAWKIVENLEKAEVNFHAEFDKVDEGKPINLTAIGWIQELIDELKKLKVTPRQEIPLKKAIAMAEAYNIGLQTGANQFNEMKVDKDLQKPSW